MFQLAVANSKHSAFLAPSGASAVIVQAAGRQGKHGCMHSLTAATLTLLSQENLFRFQENPSEKVCRNKVTLWLKEYHSKNSLFTGLIESGVCKLQIWHLRFQMFFLDT